MMKKMASGTPTTRTSKRCLTREDLAKDPFNDRKSCKETVINSTGSKMEVQEVCTEDGRTITANVRIEAPDSENVKGWMQSTVTGEGRTMSVNGTFTSKWIGAVCNEKDEH